MLTDSAVVAGKRRQQVRAKIRLDRTPEGKPRRVTQLPTIEQAVDIAVLRFRGDDEFAANGIAERNIDRDKAADSIAVKVGDTIITVDERYYRPAEVETLLGDPSEAKNALGWEPRTTVDEMIVEMMASDLDIACKNRLLRDSGYEVNTTKE